ncbi:MAG: integrase [Desulfurococcaceae archaeon]
MIEVVPSRGYRLDVRPYQISMEDVRKTLEFLRENHRLYYTVYRAMLESGARFEHVLEMIKTWKPDEVGSHRDHRSGDGEASALRQVMQVLPRAEGLPEALRMDIYVQRNSRATEKAST